MTIEQKIEHERRIQRMWMLFASARLKPHPFEQFCYQISTGYKHHGKTAKSAYNAMMRAHRMSLKGVSQYW